MASSNVNGVYNIDLIESPKEESIDVSSIKADHLMAERP